MLAFLQVHIVQKFLNGYLQCTCILFSDYRSLNKDKITLISTSSNVVSKYTSFVGVDKNRPEKVTGNMKKKVVPTPAPAAPRLCGGAPPDIPEAEAYASGEMNSLPPGDNNAQWLILL